MRGNAHRLARFGFVAKGLLWAVVALIAVEVARGERSKAQAEEGAILELARQPFGEILLIAIAGPPGESGASAAAERVGSVVLALSYAALCFYTVRFLTQSGAGGGSST